MMGFTEVYKYILSYFGIGFLGVGILLSIVLIIPAFYWLFTALAHNKGALVFRRILVMFAVVYISFSYSRSPSFFEIAGWWKTVFLGGFAFAFIVHFLRLDIARIDRRRDRALAWISAVWFGLLIFSEALLVSWATYQVWVLYFFMGSAGILCGSITGRTFVQTARRKINETAQAASGQ
jgi:hypothetical protein